MYQEYLMHYGRLGMRWGQHIFGKDKSSDHNNRNKKSKRISLRERRAKVKAIRKQLDYERERQRILSSPTLLYKNRKMFSQKELETAIKNIQFERQLKQLSDSEVRKGEQFINKFVKTAATASKVINTTKTLNKATGGVLFKMIDEKLKTNSSTYSKIADEIGKYMTIPEKEEKKKK